MMASPNLLTMYDDLCRSNIVLRNSAEPEFLSFTKAQLRYMGKWSMAVKESRRLESELKQISEEKKTLEVQLKHARNAALEKRRTQKNILKEKAVLEDKLNTVKLLLTRESCTVLDHNLKLQTMAILNNSDGKPNQPRNSYGRSNIRQELDSTASILTASELSYDDDTCNLSLIKSPRNNKRVKIQVSTGKAKKKYQDVQMITTTTVTLQSGLPKVAMPVTSSSNANPGVIESSGTLESDDSFWRKTPTTVVRKGSTKPRPESLSAPTESPASNLISLFSRSKLIRPHELVTKTLFSSENCGVCDKRIRFASSSLRCKECLFACHPDCKDQVELPCLPKFNTPTKKKASGNVLADFTPTTSPMVPPIVIHCILEIEARGMNEIGIYRIPGSEKEVKMLKERFIHGKCVPNLKNYDIHVICGCLKDFFRSLSEPLLTHTHWTDFVKAADIADPQDSYSALYQSIMEIPKPNRETLAFVINHLKNVAECVECKMPLQNLARVFGPTLVGNSSNVLSSAALLKETKNQQMVLEKMLHIPSDFWCNFINIESSPQPKTLHTTVQDSILGHRTGETPQRPLRVHFFPKPSMK